MYSVGLVPNHSRMLFMKLIKDGTFIDDIWIQVGDEDELPDLPHIIVSLNRWLDEKSVLLSHRRQIGVNLKSDDNCEIIAEDIADLSLISIYFPVFTDGRPYSTARVLREKYGFAGELRAVGNVLRDQYLFMHRCGFDSFVVRDNETVTGWLRAITDLNIWYQPTGDKRVSVTHLRSLRVQENKDKNNYDMEEKDL